MSEVLRASNAIRRSAARRQRHSQLDNHLVYGICLSRPPAETVVKGETHAATASISRTHSQCQRGPCSPRVRTPKRAKIWSSYLENSKLVERIGIEPMTSSLQS